MIDESRLENYLERVHRRFSDEKVHVILSQFMCYCLMPFESFLPAIGRAAFDVAKSYWLNEVREPEKIISVRTDCWRYLDAKGRSIDVIDQEDAALRALICVLYGEPDSEDFSADTVRWFASMLDRLGDFSSVSEQFMAWPAQV